MLHTSALHLAIEPRLTHILLNFFAEGISLFGQSAILEVTLPLSASPTVFDPNAYLPQASPPT